MEDPARQLDTEEVNENLGAIVPAVPVEVPEPTPSKKRKSHKLVTGKEHMSVSELKAELIDKYEMTNISRMKKVLLMLLLQHKESEKTKLNSKRRKRQKLVEDTAEEE